MLQVISRYNTVQNITVQKHDIDENWSTSFDLHNIRMTLFLDFDSWQFKVKKQQKPPELQVSGPLCSHS